MNTSCMPLENPERVRRGKEAGGIEEPEVEEGGKETGGGVSDRVGVKVICGRG